jgi:signal transduction histidine kinase
LLGEAARLCAQGLGVAFCKICRYRPAEHDLLIVAGYGWNPGVVGHVISRADASTPQGRAFSTGEPIICGDISKDPDFVLASFYAEHNIVSTIDVLIGNAETAYGVLEIDNDTRHEYDRHDINFLTAFANVLAEAVAASAQTALLQTTIAKMKILYEDKGRLLEKTEALTTELQEFADIVSHDLKAPLRGISLLADWVTEDIKASASAETVENLHLMRSRVAGAELLINGLVAYTRVGHDHAPAESVDIGELVADVASLLAYPSNFIIRFAGDKLVITTPRPPLEHVLQNLISNAIKHHDRTCGQVTVSADTAGDMIQLSVADDGPGIAPEYQKRIFTIFAIIKPRDEGTQNSGVGLSIVQKIVQRYGGNVHVDSAPPTRGSTFVFTWPRSHCYAESLAPQETT